MTIVLEVILSIIIKEVANIRMGNKKTKSYYTQRKSQLFVPITTG